MTSWKNKFFQLEFLRGGILCADSNLAPRSPQNFVPAASDAWQAGQKIS